MTKLKNYFSVETDGQRRFYSPSPSLQVILPVEIRQTMFTPFFFEILFWGLALVSATILTFGKSKVAGLALFFMIVFGMLGLVFYIISESQEAKKTEARQMSKSARTVQALLDGRDLKYDQLSWMNKTGLERLEFLGKVASELQIPSDKVSPMADYNNFVIIYVPPKTKSTPRPAP